MGNEQYIVPISWQVVKETLFPALEELLSGQEIHQAFIEQWQRSLPPHGHMRENPFGMFPGQVPEGYLADIDWSSAIDILPSERLRRSKLHSQLGFGTESLIKNWMIFFAGAQLPGTPSYDDRYWGRLRERDDLHVVGAKWSFRFLDPLYEITYHTEYQGRTACSTYQELDIVDVELYTLLGDLFLARRAFPGAFPLQETPG